MPDEISVRGGVMKNLLIMLMAIPIFFAQRPARNEFGGIQLLDGYSIERQTARDAVAWTIHGKSGLKIDFEAGLTQGAAADPEQQDKYAWYREQTLYGRRVQFALVKPGLKTQFDDANDSRGLGHGNVLLVTYPMGGKREPNYAANFVAKIANPQELADALLMITTFDPSKGKL